VLYDIQQGKTIAELTTPPVKYVIWSADGSLVALMSKHSKHFLYFITTPSLQAQTAITIANRNFSNSTLVHETIRIKSGAWDDSGVFVYSTLNHIKYCLPQGLVFSS
jgi:coatomer subunit alpha